LEPRGKHAEVIGLPQDLGRCLPHSTILGHVSSSGEDGHKNHFEQVLYGCRLRLVVVTAGPGLAPERCLNSSRPSFGALWSRNASTLNRLNCSIHACYTVLCRFSIALLRPFAASTN